MKIPELLAPAGSFEKAKVAFEYGADAIYCGTSKLSLRTRVEIDDNELERIMEDKEQYISKENNDLSVPITQNENKDRIYNSQVIYPIISDGNTIGSVILLSKDSKTKMSEVEQKVAQSAANFLGKQMEI